MPNLVGDLFGVQAADALYNGFVHHQASAPKTANVFLKPPLPPNAAAKRCKTSAAAAAAPKMNGNGYHVNGNGHHWNGNGYHVNGLGHNAHMWAAGGANGHSSSHSTC